MLSRVVSIPIGFSSSLQLLEFHIQRVEFHGFNPYRVFKFVATSEIPSGSNPDGLFQSLSGFQVRCNYAVSGEVLPACSVSIPIGFSSSLQPPVPPAVASSSITCFNPYRVFKFVATLTQENGSVLVVDVSIPIGFSSSLQQRQAVGLSILAGRVSIPIGFSSSLQLPNLVQQPIPIVQVSIPIGFSSSLQRRRNWTVQRAG